MNQNNNKILLIGDIDKAFLNTDLRSNENCDICISIHKAVETLKNNDYSAIAVIISGLQTKLIRHPINNENVGGLNQAIKSLKDNSSARIVLLAQMYEEPIAIRLMNLLYNDKTLVDDYMICPVDVNNLISSYIVREGYRENKTQNAIHNTQYEELSARIRHLEKLATQDDLTGLKNRRYIMEFTRQIIEYTQEEKGRVTLLVFDIDNFKKYNDLYGHIAGDEILKQASHLMLRCCRPYDVVGRIGGDEFAVVFWDDPSILKTVIEQLKVNDRRSIDSDHPHEVMLIAKRFISELEKTTSPVTNPNNTSRDREQIAATENEHGQQAWRTELGPEGIGTLTISGGLASYPRDGKTFQELFEQADKALLEAKRNGKNRIYLVGKPQSS